MKSFRLIKRIVGLLSFFRLSLWMIGLGLVCFFQGKANLYYQGFVVDSLNIPLKVETPIELSVKIIDSTLDAPSTIYFQEDLTTKTDVAGIFSIQIGRSDPATFSKIPFGRTQNLYLTLKMVSAGYILNYYVNKIESNTPIAYHVKGAQKVVQANVNSLLDVEAIVNTADSGKFLMHNASKWVLSDVGKNDIVIKEKDTIPDHYFPNFLLKSLTFRDTWDAQKNDPILQDSGYMEGNRVDTGDFLIVEKTGNYIIDGKANWKTEDAIVFDGQIWQKIPKGFSVANVGKLKAENFASGAVTTAKLTFNAINSEKIQQKAIQKGDLALNSITSAKIEDGTLKSEDFAPDAISSDNIESGEISEDILASDAIDSSKIENKTLESNSFDSATFLSEYFSSNSVTELKIADGTLGNDVFKNSVFTTDKIADGTLSNFSLGDDAINSVHVINQSVESIDIADSTIKSINIKDKSLIGEDFKLETIPGSYIKDSSITNFSIADNAITSEKLSKNAVEFDHFAPNTISNSKLGFKSITLSKIKGQSITTSEKFEDNAFTSIKIKDGSITSANLEDNCITNVKLHSDSAFASHNIAANAITAPKIASEEIEGSRNQEPHINFGTIGNNDCEDGFIIGQKLEPTSFAGSKIVDRTITSDKIKSNFVREKKLGVGRRAGTVQDSARLYLFSSDADVPLVIATDSNNIIFFSFNTAIGGKPDQIGFIGKVSGKFLYYGFTGSHKISSKRHLKEGDLVCFNQKSNTLYTENNRREPIYVTRPCSQKNARNVGGIYSQTEGESYVMAEGNGYAKVIETSRNLNIGDYLVASNQKGFAQLAADIEGEVHIFGRITENVDWKNISTTLPNGTKYTYVDIYFTHFKSFNDHELNNLVKKIRILRNRIENSHKIHDKILEF